MNILTSRTDQDRNSILFVSHNNKSNSDAIFKFLKEKFQIIVEEEEMEEFLNNLFYLGVLSGENIYNAKDTPLYGINLTPVIKKINAESIKDTYEVTQYPTLIKDSNMDIFLSASLFMLISYLA